MALTPPPVAPPAAPPLPGQAPSRANPSTFRELADAFVVWQVAFRDWLAGMVTWLAGYITWAGTNVTEMDALQADVSSKSSAATTAASSATASAAAVQANRTALDNRLYPGTYPGDPITRPDGSAVQAGDRYFNSSIARQKTYSGTVWGTDNLDSATLAAPGGDSLVWGTRPGVYRIGASVAAAADCAPAVQAAVNSFAGKAAVVVFDPAYSYVQKSTVFVPHNVSIDFNGAQIIPTAGGTLVGGFLYLLNMDASLNQVELLTTSLMSYHPFIEGFRADATDTGLTTARGFYMASRHHFEGVWVRAMSQAVRKKSGGNDQYLDRLRFRDFEVQNPQGTDYALDIDYYGDALDIDGYHHAALAGANQNAIHVRNCNGGGIRNLINGNVLTEQCSAFSLEHVHNEYGAIELRSTSAALRDVFQWYRPDLGQTNPLKVSVSAGGARYPHSVSLQNYRFVLQHLVTPFAANYTDPEYFDIFVDEGVSLNMDNVKRFHFINLDPSLGYESAPRITFDGTTSVSQWDVNASANCKAANLSGAGLVRSRIDSLPIPAAAFTDYGLSATAHGNWSEAPGTYFYLFQQLWGPRDRKVGQTSAAERSVTIADAAHIARLVFEPAAAVATGVCTIRVYRGTVSGSYDKVVELPVGSAPMLYDMGHYLGTGERWRTRTAGPVDAINTGYTKVDVVGENVVVHGTAAPTAGTWKTGDKVIVDNATPGLRPGFDCTGSGTPGSWDALARKATVFSTAFNPPSLAAGATTTTVVSAPGVIASDFAAASFDLDAAGNYMLDASCGTDIVTVKFTNITAGVVDETSGTLRARVVKF